MPGELPLILEASIDSLPDDVVAALGGDRVILNAQVVARIARFDPTRAAALVRHLSADEEATLARTSGIPGELVDRLARSRRLATRRGLADNPSTPGAVLTRLANVKDAEVRRKAIRNPNCPLEVCLAEGSRGDLARWARRNFALSRHLICGWLLMRALTPDPHRGWGALPWLPRFPVDSTEAWPSDLVELMMTLVETLPDEADRSIRELITTALRHQGIAGVLFEIASRCAPSVRDAIHSGLLRELSSPVRAATLEYPTRTAYKRTLSFTDGHPAWQDAATVHAAVSTGQRDLMIAAAASPHLDERTRADLIAEDPRFAVAALFCPGIADDVLDAAIAQVPDGAVWLALPAVRHDATRIVEVLRRCPAATDLTVESASNHRGSLPWIDGFATLPVLEVVIAERLWDRESTSGLLAALVAKQFPEGPIDPLSLVSPGPHIMGPEVMNLIAQRFVALCRDSGDAGARATACMAMWDDWAGSVAELFDVVEQVT